MGQLIPQHITILIKTGGGGVRTDGDGALDGLGKQQRGCACAQRKAWPLLAGVDQPDTLRARQKQVSQRRTLTRLPPEAALALVPALSTLVTRRARLHCLDLGKPQQASAAL